MSVPDDFFDDKKEQTNTTLAKTIAVIIAFGVVVYLSLIAYERYSVNKLKETGVETISEEEKLRILAEIEIANEKKAELSPSDEKIILNQIKNSGNESRELSEEEKAAILREIERSQKGI